MMKRSKIEWCDMTWNPITGCLHKCEYCYARRIAERFSTLEKCCDNCPPGIVEEIQIGTETVVELHERLERELYPYGFIPTLHRYRLDEPSMRKKSQSIFVCSMADLFGDWVPNEWIQKIFEACEAAPHHKYLFLTKNPGRYTVLNSEIPFPASDNFWYGTSITNKADAWRWSRIWDFRGFRRFVSIEPLCDDIAKSVCGVDWVIVGAETGSRKGKVIPKREWIQAIVDQCRESGVPVFLKNSLSDIWREPLIQELPETLRKGEVRT